MEERQAFESKELIVNSKDWKQYGGDIEIAENGAQGSSSYFP